MDACRRELQYSFLDHFGVGFTRCIRSIQLPVHRWGFIFHIVSEERYVLHFPLFSVHRVGRTHLLMA